MEESCACSLKFLKRSAIELDAIVPKTILKEESVRAVAHTLIKKGDWDLLRMVGGHQTRYTHRYRSECTETEDEFCRHAYWPYDGLDVVWYVLWSDDLMIQYCTTV